MRTRILTAIALIVIAAGAGLAVALMFPGGIMGLQGAAVAIFAALVTALSAPIVARASRHSRTGDR